MTATATVETMRPAWAYKPAWETTKSRIRRMATEQGRDPDAIALQYFGTELDKLLVWQAFQIADELAHVEREELKRRALSSGESGYCFECGVKVGETSSQCGSCKEGIPPARAHYDHSAHLSAPSSIKRGRFIAYK